MVEEARIMSPRAADKFLQHLFTLGHDIVAEIEFVELGLIRYSYRCCQLPPLNKNIEDRVLEEAKPCNRRNTMR